MSYFVFQSSHTSLSVLPLGKPTENIFSKSLRPAHQEKSLGLMSRNQRTFFSVSRIFKCSSETNLLRIFAQSFY